jgi:tripartite-type tricarboxylate transporter receptor subunit TctC
MRLVADALSKKINVPVAVLNKPGAGGAIGHREIANAKPDGYTIGMFSSGGIALPYLNAQANTIDELEPLAFFGEDPNALQVSIASGINSLKEYVERARANPGKLCPMRVLRRRSRRCWPARSIPPQSRSPTRSSTTRAAS